MTRLSYRGFSIRKPLKPECPLESLRGTQKRPSLAIPLSACCANAEPTQGTARHWRFMWFALSGGSPCR